MFGYAGFAQPAFAALAPVAYTSSITEVIILLDSVTGGRAYSAAITEAFTAGDLESVVALFAGAVSEAILSDYDAEAVVATFIAFITENFGVADVKTAVGAFAGTVAENMVLTAYNNVIATQNVSTVENINLLDAPIGFAWVKIDNTEGTTWTLVDNRQ